MHAPAAGNLRRAHPQSSRRRPVGVKTRAAAGDYSVAVAGTGMGSPATPNFFDSVGVLWRRKLLILLVLLVAVGATVGIDKSRTKQYQSTATLYFLAQGVSAGSGASTALSAQQLATDVELVQSAPVQKAVSKIPGRACTACFRLPRRHHADSGLDRPVHRPGVRRPSGERICHGVHQADA